MSESVNVFWGEPKPLILASKSRARAALLQQARIPFVIEAAAIDERAVEAPLRASGADARAIAAHLAQAKARALAGRHPDRLILGADQTLALNGRMFTKPTGREEALEQLRALAGREHALHSALCVAQGSNLLFETTETALMAIVGAYQVEGLGIQLFEHIDADHSTILGLPLIPLLAFLRRHGSLLG